MEFAAIDVETANANMASICQIGIAFFKDGTLAHEWKTYVNPQDHFDAINVSIHGIDESLVANAPTFGAVASSLKSALDGQIVVTHTAFDRVAIYQAATRWQTVLPSCNWIDTACVVRRSWKELSRSGYGLQNVCKLIGYQYRPHDALEDAKAAGRVLLAAVAHTGLDLNSWLVRVNQPIDPSLEKRISRQGNADGKLSGEVLVFTGSLTMTRREAADLAASVGCEVDSGVTRRTTILVVGDQDVQRLNGEEKSSKHRKAEDLIKSGQPIRVLCETDFRDLVRDSLNHHQTVSNKGPSPPVIVASNIKKVADKNASGKPLTESERIELLVDTIKQLKRTDNLVEAEKLLLEECDRQEAEASKRNWGVAPWYYEQLAMIYRKLNRTSDELAILERYDAQKKAPGVTPQKLKERLDVVRALVRKT